MLNVINLNVSMRSVISLSVMMLSFILSRVAEYQYTECYCMRSFMLSVVVLFQATFFPFFKVLIPVL
jgi:hypothetical protein